MVEKNFNAHKSDNYPIENVLRQKMHSMWKMLRDGNFITEEKYSRLIRKEEFTDDEKANYLYYDLGNIQGGQYALPVVVGNPRLLAANMDILKEAGVDAVPTNWDELKAACEAVKASNQDVAPLSATWGSTHYGALNEVYWPYFFFF